MSIKVRIQTVYGRDLVYPVCDKAKAVCEISGCDTLRPGDIVALKRMGFTIEVERDRPETL